MPLMEALVIDVGSSIAKSILKLWLKDQDVASDASASIIDVLKSRTKDRIVQLRAQRQFEAISARSDIESPFVQMVDLKVELQGDTVEIELPPEIVARNDFEGWVETFQQALKLGLQLEFYIGPREIESFVETFQEDGRERKTVVLYDTMPGGTGYLRKFFENLSQIAMRALHHLQNDTCATACYSCLKEFWNQRVHGLLNKQLVYSELEELALAKMNLTPSELHLLTEATTSDNEW